MDFFVDFANGGLRVALVPFSEDPARAEPRAGGGVRCCREPLKPEGKKVSWGGCRRPFFACGGDVAKMEVRLGLIGEVTLRQLTH